MPEFSPGDLIIAHKVRNPRFGTMGWCGRVDIIMDVVEGEQTYGVSLFAYGADYKYQVKESEIVLVENFVPEKAKMKIWHAKMWDHSRLGGPMESQHVKFLQEKFFQSKFDAVNWAYKMAGKKALPEWLESNKKQYETDERILADLGPIGFTFEEVEVE